MTITLCGDLFLRAAWLLRAAWRVLDRWDGILAGTASIPGHFRCPAPSSALVLGCTRFFKGAHSTSGSDATCAGNTPSSGQRVTVSQYEWQHDTYNRHSAHDRKARLQKMP